MSIHHQMNLAGMACPAFPDCFINIAGSATAMLVRFGIAAIDKHPLPVRLNYQRLEQIDPLACSRPGIEALVDAVPAAKCLGQVSPGTAYPHAVEYTLHGQAEIGLVIEGHLPQNLTQLRPMRIAEQ